jgi:site-specific DNA recombinase
MKAAIYARYSSENQRPESIADQVGACRKLAIQRGFTVDENHIYGDEAKSGARKDRAGLSALVEAAQAKAFEVVLVDDLSRLARDNYLMLSIMAELHFEGVRIVSVADGLDSEDEEATLGIQIRGIFNELQLRDLKKKTLRGQMGQKERGFFVGERTYGYRSVPVGEMRMDKKGRPRPEGYRMEIEPREGAVILRVFKAYADGQSLTSIVKTLNAEAIPLRTQSKTWSASTVTRMLGNEKYKGRWVWNRTTTRRDPRTGRRRKFEKPESEWVVHEDESLRIVPQELWEAVQKRKEAMKQTWPGGKGKRGFSKSQGTSEKHFPTHLLSGTMSCGVCGASISQVSGKAGGYYGCNGAPKKACDNKLLVRRKLAENKILAAVTERISEPEHIRYVLERVEQEVAAMRSNLPEDLRIKEAELASEQRRLDNFVNFIAEGRGSKALAKALDETERRVDSLQDEVAHLRTSRERVFKPPPVEWIQDRLSKLQKVLEQNTTRSALVLREFLGPIRLEPNRPEIGRPFYKAVTSIDAIALIGTPPDPSGPGGGSNSLRTWRRADSNRRPLRCERSALPTELRPRFLR